MNRAVPADYPKQSETIMKIHIWTVGALLAMTLAACEDTGRYPISGANCNPDDPVLQMGPADCYTPPTIGGI